MGQEKRNSRGKRKPCFKANRPQARTPYFSSSARQPNPISTQEDRKKREKKAHAIHSHALVGNQEKVICVNRSNKEQQNPPAYPQDTLKSGISQASEDSPEEEMHLQEECRAVQQRCLQQEKGIICTKGGAWAPRVEITTPYNQAKAGQRSQVYSSFDGSMFLGCKLTGHGRDLVPDFGNRLRLWYKNNV